MSSEESVNTIKEEQSESDEVPLTPQKRPSGKKTNSTNDESPTKKSKTGTPGKKTGALGPIPASYEEASSEDKTIVRMKEVENKNWNEIKQAIEEITGTNLGRSTLQIRYSRMKANFVAFEKDDEPRLLRAKKEIEDKMESEKWGRIAEAIVAQGGNTYPSSTVQKKYKDMSKKSTWPARDDE